MTMLPRLAAGLLAAVVAGLLFTGFAFAQFSPPQTIIGSVADAAGPVPAGLVVEAYVGDKLCGKGATEHVGEGEPKTTVYYVDVFAASQTEGCGDDGVEVRVKIGDRFAPETARWRAGLLQMDVTFGDIEPAPIPTATPTPTREPASVASTATARADRAPNRSTPSSDETQTPGGTPTDAEATGTPGSQGTIPAGSPGAGSPAPLRGGVTSSTAGPGAGDDDGDGGGFPLWGIVLIGLIVIGGAGGGVGLLMARSRAAAHHDDDVFMAPRRDQ